MKNIKVKVSSFTKEPYGRYQKIDGTSSGEQFRKEEIVKHLQNPEVETLTVILDAVNMDYTSSFLSEAFGGLVTKDKISDSDLSKLIIEADDPLDKSRSERYISSFKSKRAKKNIEF
ncbi:STAS-like domain-containing protein [Pseudoalteromonas aliena]|jgi:hypothetical protein|uniref:STAS-like domain-containing protein n=1 Tax=Pseudoalteromonas aliena TaxID=247523 RepID=UPI002493DECA|nr:DUF4325 domain-containing protein [Pseudoalteromonas aliena]